MIAVAKTTNQTNVQEQRAAYRPASRLRQGLFLLAALFCLTPWGSPPLALALGIVLALTHENPFHRVSKQAAKWLLQACVVALGFGMNLAVVLEAGKNGLLLAAGSIVLTLGLGTLAGRWLRINAKTSALISVGSAICGGSAVAAVGSVIGAAEGEITVAMGTTFLLNAVALYVFPLIGHALHLSQTQFGTWAGIAIHDISSVVGAASHYGPTALETATAVKLSRALWIVPVAFGAALTFRAPRPRTVTSDTVGFDPRPADTATQGKLHIPWFIGLFLLASIARSIVPGIATLAPAISHLATMGLTLTLFLIGAGISANTLKIVGWKPLLQGTLLWLAISAGSLAIILTAVR